MYKISIIYYSGSGHTEKMAEAVMKGIKLVPECESSIFQIQGSDIIDGRWNNDDVLLQLDNSDAIIFGSPTYMGNIAAQMKAFMDATGERYGSQRWKDKIASAFSISGGPSGDKFNSLVTFTTFAMQHGMIWVGLGMTAINEDGTNRLGFYFGAGGQALRENPEDAPCEDDKKTGELLGKRVAELTKKFKS